MPFFFSNACFLKRMLDFARSARGIKTLLLPAHTAPTCRDVLVKCIRFVLPEQLDAEGKTDAICNPRRFAVQLLANYVDTDFVCCPEVPQP